MRIIDLGTCNYYLGYWIDYDPKTKDYGITPGHARRYESLNKAQEVVGEMKLPMERTGSGGRG